MSWRTWLAGVATLAVLTTTAAAATTAAPWQAKAAAENLAWQRGWLDLLHYDYRPPGRARSYIDDPGFFLSPRGERNPGSELAATLAAFFATPESQCHYVARRQYLTRALPGLDAALPPARCPDYDAWLARIDAHSVVLVFASSYLNSPSSMYGHTFLRFDPRAVAEDTPLPSYALNFGARVRPGDNSLLYAWRGIAGGYPGLFAASPYLDKIKEYSRLESRDLWEYRLNLTPAEVDMMLAHIWELDGVNFDYYFFDENCSFRLLELIDVARPGLELANNFSLAAIPIDTVRVVRDAGLVAEVDYRPSNRTWLKYRIDRLTPPERELALHLADDLAVSDSPAFENLSVTAQGEVADVAYKYLRYTQGDAPRTDALAARSHGLLSLQTRYELPADFRQPPPPPVRPDRGHPTMLVSVSGGGEEGDAISDFEWRIAYHDLLDPLPGYPAGMSLNMGRLVLRARQDDGLLLQRLDLIEITSLSPRDPFFKSWSWQVDTGLDRQWTSGSDELVPQLNGGVGLSYRAPANGLAFGLLRSRLEYNGEFHRELDIAGGGSLGYLRQGRRHSTQIEIEQLWFTNGVERTQIIVGQDLSLGHDGALRFLFKRSVNDSEGYSEASVAYRHYF